MFFSENYVEALADYILFVMGEAPQELEVEELSELEVEELSELEVEELSELEVEEREMEKIKKEIEGWKEAQNSSASSEEEAEEIVPIPSNHEEMVSSWLEEQGRTPLLSPATDLSSPISAPAYRGDCPGVQSLTSFQSAVALWKGLSPFHPSPSPSPSPSLSFWEKETRICCCQVLLSNFALRPEGRKWLRRFAPYFSKVKGELEGAISIEARTCLDPSTYESTLHAVWERIK